MAARAVLTLPLLMRCTLCVMVVLATGCSFNAPPASPPEPCQDHFDAVVYPILLRDCGFPACHGDPDRFFRVFGPGRTRLDPTLAPGNTNAVDPAELDEAYSRARSMLAGAGRVEDSLLLRKPLEIDRGGAPHLGIDASGRDVFPSVDDPRYVDVLDWANTVEAVGCWP